MAPIRNYSGWNQRAADSQEPIEPYQKFFFICEGANTEVFYFKELINLRKQLGIHPMIDVCLLEKTDEDKNLSNPKRLLSFAEAQKANPDISFDKEHDQMIVVIDADIYERKPDDYPEILEMATNYNDILAVTNPAFELFLLLHYENSYDMDIAPNAEEILENRKVKNRRYISQLFSQRSGMNSKTNSAVGSLAANIDTAILQEQNLNQDAEKCIGKLTSNIGKIISDIRSIQDPIQP